MNTIGDLIHCGSKFALAGLLLLGAQTVQAQEAPPGNGFDPQQMRQRMLQRLRDQLEVTDDAEWKLVSARITQVMDARRAASSGGGGFFGGPGGGPPPNAGGQGGPSGQGGPGGPPAAGNNGPGGIGGGAGPGGPPPGGFGGFNREPNPEMEALQKALEAKAPSAELKTKMADLKAARARKQAQLEKAREDLRQVLSVRQEAVATMMGLL